MERGVKFHVACKCQDIIKEFIPDSEGRVEIPKQFCLKCKGSCNAELREENLPEEFK